MIVPVVVEGQSLRWYGRIPEIADNSIEFVQLEFRFPKDWDGMVIVAQFTQIKTYNCLLVNNRCFLPMELVAGPCEVSVFGYLNEEVTRGTTIPLKLNISRSGFVSSAETPIPPTPDLYAQLIEYFSSIAGSGGGGSGSGTINPEDIAAAVEDYLSKNPPESGEDGGYYIPGVSQPDADSVQFSFMGSKFGMPTVPAVSIPLPKPEVTLELDTTLTQEGKAADAKAVGDAVSKLSGGNANQGGGLSTTAANLLIEILEAAVYSTNVSGKIASLKEALASGGEAVVVLSSISATYSGGDVEVGTAVSALTGITVTAHYSNGTTATVTDYTLSGEIAEGNNVITVSYGGMTTTFTVMGVSEETEITLTSISATYSGGDVTEGTALTDLTGIVVTAHYSDGTSKAVTGYTLSGMIAEGENTITVSYGGKTTIFTVTGVSAIVPDDITVSDGVVTIVTVGSAVTVSDGVMTIA